MGKIDKVVNCGITILFCGIAGYIVNFIYPVDSSWAYLYLLGPIILLVGLIVAIIGAIRASVKSSKAGNDTCSNCGAKLAPEYKNCPNCGEKII